MNINIDQLRVQQHCVSSVKNLSVFQNIVIIESDFDFCYKENIKRSRWTIRDGSVWEKLFDTQSKIIFTTLIISADCTSREEFTKAWIIMDLDCFDY